MQSRVEHCSSTHNSSVRTLRPLASIGFVREVGPQAWEATPVTKAMAMETIAAGHRMVYVVLHNILISWIFEI